MRAANEEIGMMKGVAPEDKIAAQTCKSRSMEINRKYAEDSMKHQDAETKMADMMAALKEKLDVTTANYDKLMAARAADTSERGTAAAGHDKAMVQSAGVRGQAEVATGAGHDAASRYRTDNPRPSTARPAKAPPDPQIARIKADQKAVANQISAYKSSHGGNPSPTDPTWKKLLQAQAQADAALAKRSGGAGGSGGVPVPPAHASDPDGTKYEKDGKTYVKQGNALVPS